jgi:hypothetical protein
MGRWRRRLASLCGFEPGRIKQEDAVADDTSLDRTRLTALSGGSPLTSREDSTSASGM